MSKKKRTFVWILIVIIAITIFLTYSGFYYYFFIYKAQQFKEVKVTTEGKTIVMKGSVKDALNNMFQSYDVEFLVCLGGEQIKDKVYIDNMLSTKIANQSEVYVTYQKCPDEAIANIHNHVNGNCRMSYEDVYGFGASQIPYMAVMCGVDNFAFYKPYEFDEKMRLTFA